MKEIIIVMFFIFPVLSVWGQTPRAECFPFEQLSVSDRAKAEELLLKALDGEALYTLVGGLKPMSSGFRSFQLSTAYTRLDAAQAKEVLNRLAAKKPDELTNEEKRQLEQANFAEDKRRTLEKINETRAILEKWRCGEEIFADVQHFSAVYDGKRYLETVVFSRPRLGEMLGLKADFFARWGITRNSHPLEVLYAVDGDQTSARFGGYGYLFGYPDYAVRFFAQASEEEKFSGTFIERDFISLPTFAGDNRFVYAVPKGHIDNQADIQLRRRTQKVFDEYQRRRKIYVGTGKKGVTELLRDWFCAGNQCSPENAVSAL